jgi:hypothetical protein
MNKIEDYLSRYYGKDYMKFPIVDKIERHEHMFTGEHKKEINNLYKNIYKQPGACASFIKKE